MNTHERKLLQKIHDAGIILTINGNRLRYRAQAGTVTEDLKAALAELKPDLVYEYNERAGILEYDAGMPPEIAEQHAETQVLQQEQH